MGAREVERGARGQEQIARASHRTCTWLVLLLCGVLTAFEIEKIDLFNAQVYVVQDRGILYYVGETEPATEDLLLIEQWMRMPVILLLYDGPSEMRTTVENCLIEVGALIGVGDLFYVKVRKQSSLCYVRLVYKDQSWDNSDQLWKEDEFENKLREKLKEYFSSQLDRPEVGYRVLIADRVIVEKRENQSVPVKIEVAERIVSLTVNDEQRLVSEGFYNFYGRIIYVDEDTYLSTTAFFENAQMVYKTSKGYVVYRDGALFFPDGRKVVSPEPFDVFEDRLIPWRVNVRSEGSSFVTTVVGRFDDTLVLSCGMIAPADLSWFLRVSGPIIEWAQVEQRLYVLDIAGYVRAIDLKSRRTLWEKLVPNSWGIATHGNEVYVGSGERLLRFNDRGELVEEQFCQDFGVSSQGIIALTKTEGRFIRNRVGSVLVEGSKATVYTDQAFEFEDVQKVRFFDWGIVLVGESGCWVVEGR